MSEASNVSKPVVVSIELMDRVHYEIKTNVGDTLKGCLPNGIADMYIYDHSNGRRTIKVNGCVLPMDTDFVWESEKTTNGWKFWGSRPKDKRRRKKLSKGIKNRS